MPHRKRTGPAKAILLLSSLAGRLRFDGFGVGVARALGDGIANVRELSRRPAQIAVADFSNERSMVPVLAVKRMRPAWGAKKVRHKLWPNVTPDPDAGGAPVSVRTVARWLKTAGMVAPRPPAEPLRRFEREACNQLWQLDLKGIEVSWGYRR